MKGKSNMGTRQKLDYLSVLEDTVVEVGGKILSYKRKNDPITLIVARKGLGKKISDAIAPVLWC